MEELRIEANTDKLDNVLNFINRILQTKDASIKAQMQIQIAVEEIFVNIANYAYAPGTGMATIQVKYYAETNAVEICFIDEGKKYNPLEKPDPDITLSAEEREIGGLGIFMVKKSMDSMRYDYIDGKNVLTVLKHC